ncbi:23S rRNA (uridine(2552)-2'-O)-methyltransferase RlmE [Methylocucumis oryzae]|uniref:Ribosomal RNA large subunit methyltransferase E n=1 Tax=Methylocucumis oryzae TaxID=1632867 RepID=A0A0F3IPS7_9GAMM|nr:23S rRNA (uridine(2552)-2'-O)-methyltransferase RlmE [Methylocucumis oryzae]KJV07589.1 23S rRNA methyltransferase [Methylocucumis oryzae]
MARSKSSHLWLKEHFDDEYVKMAQAQGYRSRAVYKLKEIQDKEQLIKPNMNIVDLGAAPGGWSQYARQLLDKNSKLIALDILPMEAIAGVDIIQGDFTEEEVLQNLYAILDNSAINLIMSDMAPNMSGNKDTDQARSVYLAELALAMAEEVLVKNGSFLIKAFQGSGFENLHRDIQCRFNKVVIKKPKASRPRSNEVYILAKGFK